MNIDINKIYQEMARRDMGIMETASAMDLHRSQLWRVLNGKAKGGYKFIAGLKKAFPDVPMDNFFIS